MKNRNDHQSSSSSLRAAQRSLAAAPGARPAIAAPKKPCAPQVSGSGCRRLLEQREARRLALFSLCAWFRNFAALAVALLALAGARGASLHTAFGCSEGVDLKAFGQTFPEVRTQESEASFGTDVLRTDGDQVSVTLSARRLELRRTLARWSGAVTPTVGVNAQGLWSAPLPDKFQDVGLDLTWQNRCSPEWMLMMQARPGWRTAGTTTLVGDGFGATGSVLAMWQMSKSVQFAFGAAGDSLARSSHRLIPVAGLDWGFAPHWRLSLGLPRTGLFCQVRETLELGLAAEGGWTTYYVRQRDAATYPYGRPLTETKLEHLEGRVGFQANWNITPAVQFNVSVGAAAFRRFEYPDRALVLKSDGATGGYGSLGVTVNF